MNVLAKVPCVGYRDDGVQAHLRREFLVVEEARGYRRRVGQAAGLDQDVIELIAALEKFAEHLDEVIAHIDKAADAAVGESEDFLFGFFDQVGINRDFTELVFDHRDAIAVALAQNVIEQRGLACAEKAGEDGDRQRDRRRNGLLRVGRRHSRIRGEIVHAE